MQRPPILHYRGKESDRTSQTDPADSTRLEIIALGAIALIAFLLIGFIIVIMVRFFISDWGL